MRLVVGITKPRRSILGTVYAGIVAEKGSKVAGFAVGDKVFGMTGFGFGTYAEFIAVRHTGNVMAMPSNATFEEAASIIFGGQTAIHFLHKARIAERHHPRVLILGATGSVGSAAIQIARHHGAHITAVCSTNGRGLVESLGGTDIVLYDKEPVPRKTDTYDIIVDAIGTYNVQHLNGHLRDGGTVVSVSAGYASETIEQLRLLKDLFERGELTATIDRIYTLDEIVEAHRYVETGRKKGNVVITVGG
jgi:NADPH:quinone reductase-like Zn-dependent oxidoreductase